MPVAGGSGGRRRITSSTTMWLRRSLTTTRISLAQQADRRMSLAASRSPGVISGAAPQPDPLAEVHGHAVEDHREPGSWRTFLVAAKSGQFDLERL